VPGWDRYRHDRCRHDHCHHDGHRCRYFVPLVSCGKDNIRVKWLRFVFPQANALLQQLVLALGLKELLAQQLHVVAAALASN
jgi:hypothetical protein